MKEVHLVPQEDPLVVILVGVTRVTLIHSTEARDLPDHLLDMEERGATQEAILDTQEHLATHQETEDQHLPDSDQDIPHRATQDTDLLALLATILLLEHPDTILAMVPVQENILPLTSQLLGQGDQVSRDQVLMVTILLLLPVNMRALLQPHGPLLYTTDLIPRDHLELRHQMRWSREVIPAVKMVDLRAQNLV